MHESRPDESGKLVFTLLQFGLHNAFINFGVSAKVFVFSNFGMSDVFMQWPGTTAGCRPLSMTLLWLVNLHHMC